MFILSHLFLGYIITKMFGFNYPYDSFWVILFCSIAPDVDTFFEVYVSKRIKHRGAFHTPIFSPAYSLLATLTSYSGGLFPINLFLVGTLACIIHFAADLISPQRKDFYVEGIPQFESRGIRPFYPFSSKRYIKKISNTQYKIVNLIIFMLAIMIWISKALFRF